MSCRFFLTTVKGTMPLHWVACCAVLGVLGLASGQKLCRTNESNKEHAPLVLESLECHNDYHSKIICRWVDYPNTSSYPALTLHHLSDNNKSMCKPYNETWTPSGQRTVHCLYKPNRYAFSLTLNHTFFFKSPHPPSTPPILRLPQHVKVRPPANLSEHAEEGGGRLLHWASPYPPSSPLTPTLTYQLSYRRQDQDWTVAEVSGTQLRLNATFQQPGCGYEARVRALGRVGLWSEWSPTVEWQTSEGPCGPDCVLEGDGVVTCSWRLKRELAQFFIYQLSCRHNKTAPLSSCCVNSTVLDEPSEPDLRFSCSLVVPHTEELHLEELDLELLPTPKIKSFPSSKNIRLDPPKLKVKQTGENWYLEWSPPPTGELVKPSFQVRYYPVESQNDVKFFNVSTESHYCRILGSSLHPSQPYLAQVRAQVLPEESSYQGPPSDWSNSVTWTSNPASASLSTVLYCFLSLLLAIIFTMCYFALPACQRRIRLWELSLPSPVKSKALSEITRGNVKSSPGVFMLPHKERYKELNQTTECLNLSLCSAISFDDLQLKRDLVHELDHLPSSPLLAVDRNNADSGLSFSGPYIFCSSTSPGPGTPPGPHKPDDSFSDPPTPCSDPARLPGEMSCQSYVVLPHVSQSCSLPDLSSKENDVDDWPTNHGNHRPASRRPHSEVSQDRLPSDDPPPYTPNNPLHLGTSGYCILPEHAGENWGSLQSPEPPVGGGSLSDYVR